MRDLRTAGEMLAGINDCMCLPMLKYEIERDSADSKKQGRAQDRFRKKARK